MSWLPEGLLVAWCGDDFTGSAAVMEALVFAGLPAVLFLDIPSAAQLARFPDVRGIGIASTARAHGPEWMERNLPPVFEWLARQGAAITQYKVCSTLDSSPETGSIGKAVDLAAGMFEGWIPCVVAAPGMRRYQVFGHLFAGTPDGVFRLDRHPVMAQHPVTPMAESDVVQHLARQTHRKFGLIDLEALRQRGAEKLHALRSGGAEVIAFDNLTADDERRIGELIWENRADSMLAVGSQGLEYALIAHWCASGQLERFPEVSSAGAAERMIVISGSVSVTTASQIDWAEKNGFEPIELDAAALIRGEDALSPAIDAALAALGAGRDPIIHTARGPEDPAVDALRRTCAEAGVSSEQANMDIGAALGRVLAALLKTTSVRRAVISGGDTSGHACRKLDIFAFTALAPTLPGAALLTAHSERAEFDGIQLALKGGQMGSQDYFGWIKRGGGRVSPQATNS